MASSTSKTALNVVTAHCTRELARATATERGFAPEFERRQHSRRPLDQRLDERPYVRREERALDVRSEAAGDEAERQAKGKKGEQAPRSHASPSEDA
jgi:hypothetical protein